MSEARQRKRAFDDLLKKYPWCIYCGGVVQADTVEHNPARIIFLGKQRPKGLEFPSCEACNRGTSHADLVAGLMSRVYPDAPTDAARDELKKILNAVANNIPGLLLEMEVSRNQEKILLRTVPGAPPGAALLRVNGPLVSRHMTMFGAKLGFALHYEAYGSAVPIAGGVQPLWFSNVQAARGELPMELINLLPGPRTLRQGTKHVGDQFQYSWQVTEEGRHGFFYAVFRSSFAIGAVSALDRSEFLMKNADKFPVVAPGDFKK